MADNRIRIYDGTLLDPFNPKPEQLQAHNFIHSSSLVNRYAGNGRWPYSIGQHSYVLSRYVPKELRRAALIHDWAECWFQDMAQPIKARLGLYSYFEHRAMIAIGRRFGVTEEEFDLLKPYDRAIYINERDAFMNRTEDSGMGDDRTGLRIPQYEFRERDWRHQRAITHTQFNLLFPEHHTDYFYD